MLLDRARPPTDTPPQDTGAAPQTAGLTEEEARARRERGEGNDFHPATSRTYLQILRQHAFSFINTILFAIGFALIAMGRIDDAILTAGMVVLNVVMGVGQEGRAKQKLDKIALLTRPSATVIRDGRTRTIDPNEIVLGDLLEVRSGDQIVVDGKLVGDNRIEVDESLLTGESDRVLKQGGDDVFSGSFCVTGRGQYVAEKVGAASLANRLTLSARAFRQVKTPLQRDVDFVVRLLVLLVTQLGILIAASFLYNPVPAVESMQIAAVLVALVPQGLFAMITVTYAMGALRMSGKGALIQQINAIESLSNVNILCLDKTGTLTSNTLRLESIQPLGISEEELKKTLGAFVAGATEGNRTAEAIAEALPAPAPRVGDEVPFSSVRKWSAMSLLDDDVQGVYVLGAPEMIMPAIRPGPDLANLCTQVSAEAEKGLRVLLFVRAGQDTQLLGESGEPRLPGGLIPVGLLSLRDELRHEVQSTLRGFAEAGVRIKVISGDNPQTVAALARQAGLEGDLTAISGLDLARMSDEEFARAADEGTIFGRITPQQKEQLVRALRAKGHYVAMIGDGVNDVLSLKQAHLAIAMQSGSQATRGVADIVLLDDSFAVLPRAVLEGQRIIRGMQDVMRLVLTHTGYVALVILGCAIIDVAFPTTPKLRSAVTLLTVGLPTLVIAAWARPGPPPRSLMRPVFRFVLPAAFSISVLGLAVYLTYLLNSRNDVELARSALATTMLFCGLLLIPFVEPPTPAWVAGDDLSGDWRPTILGVGVLALYAGLMLFPPFRDFLQIKPLPLLDLALIAALVLAWGAGLRLAWRKQTFERLVSMAQT